MKYGIIIIFFLMVGIWETIILPKSAQRKITKEVERMGGKVAEIELVSRRECIYNVGYVKNDKLVRNNVKYRVLAKLTWL